MVVIEQNATLADLFPEDLVLGLQILVDLLLLSIDPAGEDNEQKLPRLQNEVHGRPDAVTKPIASTTDQAGSIG